MAELVPNFLYSAQSLARMAGVHPVTIYKAISGVTAFPVPVFVRLGRSVRFRGSND